MKWIWLIAVLLFLPLPLRGEPVFVTRQATKVTYKEFDPLHPTDPKPPLTENEAALCEYRFGVGVQAEIARGPVENTSTGFRATIQVTHLSVRVTQTITIWLPKPCETWIKLHEEGHRTIAQNFYKDADKTAKAVGAPLIGASYSGEGATREAAYRDAARKASTAFNDSYTAAIYAPCDRVQKIYDELCPSFRRNGKTVEETIVASMAQWKKEQADQGTPPDSKPAPGAPVDR